MFIEKTEELKSKPVGVTTLRGSYKERKQQVSLQRSDQ